MKNKFNAPAGHNIEIFTDWCDRGISDGGTFYSYNRHNFQDAMQDYDFIEVICALKTGDYALAGRLMLHQAMEYAIDSARCRVIADGIGYESD